MKAKYYKVTKHNNYYYLREGEKDLYLNFEGEQATTLFATNDKNFEAGIGDIGGHVCIKNWSKLDYTIEEITEEEFNNEVFLEMI